MAYQMSETITLPNKGEPPPSYAPPKQPVIPKAPITPPHEDSRINPPLPQDPFPSDLTRLGPDPADIACPRCHHNVRTRTAPKAGIYTGYSSWLLDRPNGSIWSAVGCIVLNIFGALIPFLLPSCKDIEHICPICIAPFLELANL